jgi:predicted Zn-dependent peptidase
MNRRSFLKNLCVALILSFYLPVISQVTDGSPKPKLNYETVPNDPYGVRIYTLSNGMKVYLSVYKNAPRIQTMIAVKAGSKNDPADATGLAHYLEHMVFKGTDKYGTKDFANENVQITKIEELYEKYRNTKDPVQRKNIYHEIDSISGVAAKYAIANEYDKMLAGLGAQGTNAFTDHDQTVYVNDIPSNQVENWLQIESERFRKPVLRLFHTELEAVYEEKNRSLDSDNNKMWEELMSGLFKKHTYGTQTTIGTIDHLKNPSMKEIMKYYNKNYVPNNMGIFMSGDFDPDRTIAQIEKHFGKFNPKAVESYKYEKEEPITSKIAKEVKGPDAESIFMGWRFNGAATKDEDMITLISAMLSNGKAGLIDLNLNQAQKVLSAGCFPYVLKDYGVHMLWGMPKAGQSLENVEQLLLSQINELKEGKFSEWLMPAVITDMKLQKTKELENNNSRTMTMMYSFTNDENWQHSVGMIERLSKITKQEVIDFVKANYNNDNYVVVYKRTGSDANVEKVEKPAITPVPVDRDNKSDFVRDILASAPAPIAPKFIDYEKDIAKAEIKSGIPVWYNKNVENMTFDLYYLFDMGTNNDKMLRVAIDYIPYLGTSKKTAAQVQEEFYKLGCNINVSVIPDQTWISLNGLSENFEKALQLFEELMSDPKVEKESLKNLIDDNLKKREDQKLDKGTILSEAMVSYALYGPVNPFTYILSEAELKKISVSDLSAKLKSLHEFQHKILYYGPLELNTLTTNLNSFHRVSGSLKPVPPEMDFKRLPLGNAVFVTNYDMKQAEIVMLSDGYKYDPSLLPEINLYNRYFGLGMSAVVFQDLRESKALAYSTFSFYSPSRKPTKNYYNYSYIGSQADKLGEAMKGMKDLLTEMPKAEGSFNSAKELLLQEIRSTRITRGSILFNYEQALRFGENHDMRKDVFEKAGSMTYEDVKKFQETYIKGKPITTLVLGSKKELDMKTLEKYGPIRTLGLKEIFGY